MPVPPPRHVARLRRARPEDARAIAALHLAARAQAMPWLAVVHPPEDVERHVADELLPACDTWVAEQDGIPVAYAARDGDELTHLYVAPAHQGRGLGCDLLELAGARATGPLELWAFARNGGALAFYASRGFAEVDRTDGAANEEREPDVRLRAAAAGQAQLSLYVRPGCHLCEEALEALDGLRARHAFALRTVDIEADDVLHRDYLERIPVLALDGEELSDFEVDVPDLAQRLTARARR